MRWQKPQLGRQKSSSVSSPRKSARLTVWPARSGRLKSGAGSPTLGLAGGRGAVIARCPLPLVAAAMGSVPGPAGESAVAISAPMASAP